MSHARRRDGDGCAETTSTRAVLDQYRSGVTGAEQRLFLTHRERLLRRARRHPWMRGLSAHTTCEDVVDEVFVRALAGGFFERFDDRGRGSLLRALTRILERVVADGYRRLGTHESGRLRTVEQAAAGPETPSWRPVASGEEPSPTSNVRAVEMLGLCRRILDPEEWEVWRLTEIVGLESRAIGERIGRSASASRSVLHRARAKLLRVFAAAAD
jgi:RNA polymerase sigma factor (sigma-70 family)